MKYTVKVQTQGQRWRYFALPTRSKGGGGGVGPSSQADPDPANSAVGTENVQTKSSAGPQSAGSGKSEDGKSKNCESASAGPLYPRNIVAIGEGPQGSFEGIVATNKERIPRGTKSGFVDPQFEAEVFQESLLELPNK